VEDIRAHYGVKGSELVNLRLGNECEAQTRTSSKNSPHTTRRTGEGILGDCMTPRQFQTHQTIGDGGNGGPLERWVRQYMAVCHNITLKISPRGPGEDLTFN